MKNYDDRLEKSLTAIFGTIGTLAVIINLFVKGLTTENMLDALKDIAGLIVVIAVFLIANKMFRKDAKPDFNVLFEKYLKDWISQNDYLVCENFDDEGKGKFKKRYCSMIIDHSNLVTRIKYAKDAAPNKEKGAFVYLPYFDENDNWKKEFDFRFNKRTFSRQNIYKTEDGEVNLKAILEQFSMRINDNFHDLKINSKAFSETITVSFESMEQNEENARKLVDMVEFVKTMVLALA
jgi:hypothetical protein